MLFKALSDWKGGYVTTTYIYSRHDRIYCCIPFKNPVDVGLAGSRLFTFTAAALCRRHREHVEEQNASFFLFLVGKCLWAKQQETSNSITNLKFPPFLSFCLFTKRSTLFRCCWLNFVLLYNRGRRTYSIWTCKKDFLKMKINNQFVD